MKIVHFATDEKFLNVAQSLFEEAFPGCNTYLVPEPKAGVLKYIADTTNVRLKPRLWFKLARFTRPAGGADLLVVHGMTSLFARTLRAARPDGAVVWIGWGFDYYELLEGQLGPALLEQTAGLQAALEPAHAPPPHGRRPSPIATVAAHIDVFSVNPSEVEPLRRALPELRGACHVLPSFTVEDVFDRGPARMDGPDILLGNSGSPSNNHLEAFDALLPLIGNTRRLVVPLSYGHAAYAEHVARAGRERFGARFEALRTWLPIDAYNLRLRSCGLVVMNHRRQKAVGNIGAALYKGAKVFLRPENPLFGFYTSLGAVIHSTEMLEAGDSQALAPLPEADRQQNREVVRKRWSRASVVASVRGLIAYRR